MTTLKRNLLPAVVFITGASVLIVEVLAVRVLSPYYGNTIFTVSSVISVILLGLSVGYYAGGRLADRRPSLEWFFGIILMSGLVLLLLYSLGTILLPFLGSALSIAVGPLVSSALLFLLPALLLGTLSPYAVKLQSVYFPEQGVGIVAGQIFFWSTLGSISGSLLAGFVLIPSFGLDHILIANGIVLFALGLAPLFVLGVKRAYLYKSMGVFVLLLGMAVFAIPAAGGTIVYRHDGVYQRITIYEGEYLGRPARFLLLDRSESGAVFLDSEDPTDLVYDYTKYHRLYKIFTPKVENALVLGGGAYSIPKALLRELPNANVDVAEIEPSFFDLSRKYFRLVDSPRLHNYVEDGRRFLHDSRKKYDLMFGDVYYSFFSVPPQFTTQEFFALARERLNPGGVFIANMIGDLSRQQPSLIMSEIKTFQTVFPNSYFFAVEARENTDLLQNITLVGYNSDRKVDVEAPPVSTDQDPLIRYLRFKVIDVARRFELSPYPVLTDNFSPVEYQTAQALQRSLSARTVINGDEMRALVDQQVRYGPRFVSAPGHQRVRDFLLTEIGGLAQEVTTQTWKGRGANGKIEELTNIIGRFSASEEPRVVLAAHYDSSKFADGGEAGVNRPAPGANDPASGPAVLLDLARMLITSPVVPKVGVDIVFFDGTERQDRPDSKAPHGAPYGSVHYASHLSELYGTRKPVSALVLDTVCGKNVRLLKEQSSVANAPAQVAALWNIGQNIDSRIFQNRIGPEIPDDQTALNQAGIPSVLVIDSAYPQSHTSDDTVDKCSPDSMRTVARVVLEYLNGIQ